MRAVALTSLKKGIDRTRIKGGAQPDTLFDGVNMWVTVSLSARPRPGTRIASVSDTPTPVYSLPPGTVGLTTFEGDLVVFADQLIDLSDYPGFRLEILNHPNAANLAPTPNLVKIHFAEPYLGFLYVAAEWSDGSTFHYWLREFTTWQATTVYRFGDLVEPTVPNGFTYQATRLNPANPVWTPDTAVTLGDIREPTVPNSFQYEVIDTIGTAPRTGTTEPTWPTTAGATVTEDANFGPQAPPAAGGSGDPTAPPQDIIDRYGLGPNAPTSGRTQTEVE